MATPTLPLDPQLYRETLSQLKLQEISLRELHLVCQNPVVGELNIHIAANAEATHQNGELRFHSRHKITARNKEHELFAVEVLFVVVLNAPDQLPDEFVDIYVANNLGLTVFPYVREAVSSMTSRMGLPPLTLPYIYSQYQKAPDKPKPRARRKKAAE